MLYLRKISARWKEVNDEEEGPQEGALGNTCSDRGRVDEKDLVRPERTVLKQNNGMWVIPMEDNLFRRWCDRWD